MGAFAPWWKNRGQLSTIISPATDEERQMADLAMLDNDEVKAILCARGGYGMTRIIDRIDFRRYRKHRK